MRKQRVTKRIPILIKISMVFLTLTVLNVLEDKLTDEKNFLWNQSSDTVMAAELTNQNTIDLGENTDTYTFEEFKFQVISEYDKTACITGMKPMDDATELVIPESVVNNGTTYTVTDINFDNKSVQYEKIKTIKIPASVTGKILITSTDLQGTLPEDAKLEARPYCVPFPNLERVIFLGKTAPKTINIFSYLSYNDVIYEVPSGSEAAYEAVSEKSFEQPVMCFYDYDDTSPFKEYEVAPVIVSDARTNPEPHLFQTDKGVYIVTNSTADGKGTVALIKCKNLIRKYNYIRPHSGNYVYPEWDDFTIESETEFGSYKYTVTSIESGALLDFRNITMLTIPDTITEMKENCIYAGNYLNFVFFSTNCKTISDNIFNCGENGVQNGIVYYVPNGVSKMEATFYPFHLNKLYLPKDISISNKLVKGCDKVVYYNKTGDNNLENDIIISSNKITVTIGSTKKITATNSNSEIKDTIHFISMDPSVAYVSDSGVITPKHKGTAYVLVFSEATGAHQLIQVTVENKTFKSGIFTYRINYSEKPEVTIISCKPSKSMKVLTIPSSVVYKGKKYTVTQVCAGDYVIDDVQWYNYTSESGFPRIYDTVEPLISDTNAKGCNITEVVFPSTIKRTVSSLGNLTKLKRIEFKGTTAPTLIAFSEQNYTTATVYVPAKALTAYKKTKWKKVSYKDGYELSELYNGYSIKSKIKLKTY